MVEVAVCNCTAVMDDDLPRRDAFCALWLFCFSCYEEEEEEKKSVGVNTFGCYYLSDDNLQHMCI